MNVSRRNPHQNPSHYRPWRNRVHQEHHPQYGLLFSTSHGQPPAIVKKVTVPAQIPRPHGDEANRKRWTLLGTVSTYLGGLVDTPYTLDPVSS